MIMWDDLIKHTGCYCDITACNVISIMGNWYTALLLGRLVNMLNGISASWNTVDTELDILMTESVKN